MRVEHQKFGFGNVLKLEGSAHNPVATIKFDQNGEKKIMLNYAKLMIVASLIVERIQNVTAASPVGDAAVI
jgi:hypothetical protein